MSHSNHIGKSCRNHIRETTKQSKILKPKDTKMQKEAEGYKVRIKRCTKPSENNEQNYNSKSLPNNNYFKCK